MDDLQGKLTAASKAFASAGVREQCETNGKLINFMVWGEKGREG